MDGDTDTEDMDVEEQAEHAARVHPELVEAMGFEGVVTARVDDDTVLVAHRRRRPRPARRARRGTTLQAIEELVRAVVQHGLSGRSARLRVDVGGYRERRREALADFARQVARRGARHRPGAGARADEPARPQGRPRRRRRDRRCGDELRGRRAPAPCGDPPGVTLVDRGRLLEVLGQGPVAATSSARGIRPSTSLTPSGSPTPRSPSSAVRLTRLVDLGTGGGVPGLVLAVPLGSDAGSP